MVGSPGRRPSSTRPRSAGLEPPTLALADILTPNDIESRELAGADGTSSARARRLLGRDPGDRSVLDQSRPERGGAGERSRAAADGSCRRRGRRGRHGRRRGHPERGTRGRPGRRPRLSDAAEQAVSAAAMSVTRAGARGGMPDQRTLEASANGQPRGMGGSRAPDRRRRMTPDFGEKSSARPNRKVSTRTMEAPDATLK